MKMSFKLTIWAMLFIIVVVLALSYFMNTNVSQEGFGSYNRGLMPMNAVKIAPYDQSRKLVKLIDCLYFDESTGNIIEIVSKEYDEVAKDTPEDEITGINIINRSNGKATKYKINYVIDSNNTTIAEVKDSTGSETTITENNVTFDSAAKQTFVYKTEMIVPQYYVVVQSNNNDTLLHIIDVKTNIIDVKTNIIIGSYLFSKGGTNTYDNISSFRFIPQQVTFTDNNISGADIHKISDNVVYDKTNNNVLASIDANDIMVIYPDGSNDQLKTSMYDSKETNDSDPDYWVVNTSVGNTIIHYPVSNGVYISALEMKSVSTNNKTDYKLDNNTNYYTKTVTDASGNTTTTYGFYIDSQGFLTAADGIMVDKDSSGNTISGYKEQTNGNLSVLNSDGSWGSSTTPYTIDNTTDYFTRTTNGTTTYGYRSDGNNNIIDINDNVVVSSYSIDNTTNEVLASVSSGDLVASSKYFENKTVEDTTSSENNGGLSELEKSFEILERGKLLFANMYGLDTAGSGGVYGEDYFLKTEVVPPVCPTCPSCCNGCNGVCGDCGGNGGSGTKTTDGSSLTNGGGNVISQTIDSTGNAISKTIDATGNVVTGTLDAAGNVIGTAGNVVTGTLDTAGGVVTGTLDTAGGVVTGTLDATGNVISQVGSGTSQVVGDVYGATKQVIGDLYTGATTLGTAATQVPMATTGQYPMQSTYGYPVQGQPQFQMNAQMPGYQSGVSNYNYYGALPDSTSNYVARTADFSSFSK